MDKYLIAVGIGILIGVASAGIPAIIFSRTRERAFQKVSNAYERIIAKCDDRVEQAEQRLADYMDRWYGEKNLPPGRVDMAQLHDERRQEEKEKRIERRNGGPLAVPPRIGKIDDLQARMEEGIRSGKYARPAVAQSSQGN